MPKIYDQDKSTGELDILFRKKENGASFVARQFYKLPMQVMPSYTQDEDGTAFLYMLNPSSGLLQHDRIKLSFELEEGAKALVTTPSTNKIYRMDEGYAVQNVNIKLARNAELEYLPEHNVPFKESSYFQHINYYIDSSSKLIAWDIVTPGKKLCDERFDFNLYYSETNLFVNGNRLFCERMKLEPTLGKDEFLNNYLAQGIYEGKDMTGTMIVYSPSDKTDLFDELYERFYCFPEMIWGASMPCENLLVVKFLAENVMYMQEALASIWDCVRRAVLGKPAVKIRKI